MRTETPRRSPDRVRRGLQLGELGLGALGLVCLLLYGVACAQASWVQQRERAAFERALHARFHAEAPEQGDWSAARVRKYREVLSRPVRALGRLVIPDAEVSVMVLDGTDETTLDRAVGHIEGTARPGESGNVGIAGHRDGFFRGLRHLERGDPMSLETLSGVGRYEVVEVQIVAPERVEVLAPSDEPALTLVTCYPFYFLGEAPKRYVVRAERVGFEPHPTPSVEAGPALARR